MSKSKKQTKQEISIQEHWPKITKGNHSTFIEHQDGKIEHHIDWDKLSEEINKALTNHKKQRKIKT